MGKLVTPSVDIYAFGIMFYEMLLGTRPYSGDALETIFYKIVHEPLDLSPLVAAGVPQEVVAIVEHCSMKDAAARYPDFSGVITDLENALGAQLTKKATTTHATPLPQGSPATKSRLPLILGAAIVVIVLAALGFYWSSQNKSVPPKPPGKKAQQTVQKLAPERIETKGGPMHLVSGGAFLFGQEKKTAELPAFYMDETEVSNQYYARFCAEDNYKLPQNFDAGHPALPVVNVTIDDARAFATWAGKQLPNSLEWEKGARGKDGRTYPWGDEKDPSRANVADNPNLKQHGLQPVDSFSESVSPFNLLNMVGNVWEFIDEPWTPDADAIKAFAGLLSPPLTAADRWVTTRGGSYRLPLGPRMTWDVQPVPGRFHNEVIGFRCVLRDVK
jgi:formylglycine-generating enzyme required for sulfatase activity